MDTGLSITPHKRHGDRHVWRWIAAIIVAGTICAAAWSFYNYYTTGTPLPLPIPIAKADPSVDESDVSQAVRNSHAVSGENPRYLSIPSLNVTTVRVFAAGMNAQNLLEAPRNIHDVAWYNKSMAPGSGYGAVLLSGHGSGNTKDGAFAQLGSLKPGDQIIIERGDGQKITYAVVENKIMNVADALTSGMQTMTQSATPGKEGLNIIATTGKWIPKLQQFDQRVMLRAATTE